jgi:hypothetical protein
MSYLLDSNIFIQAKNMHYGFDFCPAFWNWLLEENASGKVYSIAKVGDELVAGDDELAEWAKERTDGFFLPVKPEMLQRMVEVSTWVTRQSYTQAAIDGFFKVADYYLVVHALTTGDTVVTHEKPAGSRRNVKIPDVCVGLGIKMMSPYEMLRKERARFVLGEKR